MTTVVKSTKILHNVNQCDAYIFERLIKKLKYQTCSLVGLHAIM